MADVTIEEVIAEFEAELGLVRRTAVIERTHLKVQLRDSLAIAEAQQKEIERLTALCKDAGIDSAPPAEPQEGVHPVPEPGEPPSDRKAKSTPVKPDGGKE